MEKGGGVRQLLAKADIDWDGQECALSEVKQTSSRKCADVRFSSSRRAGVFTRQDPNQTHIEVGNRARYARGRLQAASARWDHSSPRFSLGRLASDFQPR